MILIGPCMLAAPLVAVLAILAVPLWPIAIVVLAVARLVFWPFERLVTAMGYSWATRASSKLAVWFKMALKPWSYFDPPKPPV
jgi:hypothetical protein